MSDMKNLLDEIRAEFDKLETGVSTRLHALLDRVLGDAPALEAEVKSDAETVAHDAEAAAALVATETVADVEHVAAEVAAEVPAAVESAVKA